MSEKKSADKKDKRISVYLNSTAEVLDSLVDEHNEKLIAGGPGQPSILKEPIRAEEFDPKSPLAGVQRLVKRIKAWPRQTPTSAIRKVRPHFALVGVFPSAQVAPNPR